MICWITWGCPWTVGVPGKVTSRVSAASLALSRAVANSAFLASKACVSSSRISLANFPTFGRSSLLRSFIPRKTVVKGPFLPNILTRMSFKCSRSALALISWIPCLRNSSNFSRKPILSSSSTMVCNNWGSKKSLVQQGTRLRGTTLVYSHAIHSLIDNGHQPGVAPTREVKFIL